MGCLTVSTLAGGGEKASIWFKKNKEIDSCIHLEAIEKLNF